RLGSDPGRPLRRRARQHPVERAGGSLRHPAPRARTVLPAEPAPRCRGDRHGAGARTRRGAGGEGRGAGRGAGRPGARAAPGSGGFARQVGAFIINLSLLSIFAGLMFFYRPTVYQDFRSVLLVALLMATTIAAAAVIAGSGAPFELVPMAFPALVIAMLWDGR